MEGQTLSEQLSHHESRSQARYEDLMEHLTAANSTKTIGGKRNMDEAISKVIMAGGGDSNGGFGGGMMPFLMGALLGGRGGLFGGGANAATEGTACAAEIAKTQAQLENSILTSASLTKDAIQNSVLFTSNQAQVQTAAILAALNTIGDAASARSEADLRAQLVQAHSDLRSSNSGVSVSQTVNQAQSQAQFQAQLSALSDRLCSLHQEQVITNRNVNFGTQLASGNASGVQVK